MLVAGWPVTEIARSDAQNPSLHPSLKEDEIEGFDRGPEQNEREEYDFRLEPALSKRGASKGATSRLHDAQL
jgi:hypothetical protein